YDSIAIARHPQRRHRLQRIHQADHVRRTELGGNEFGDRLANRNARATPCVIVIEKNGEQPDIVTRRFEFLVRVRADRHWRTVGAGHTATIELDQLERLHGLRLVVLGDLEVALFQICDRLTGLAIGDDDIDTYEVDARP